MANYDNRKSYNNQPLKDGETMVPIFISDWDMVRTYSMDRDNMETWRINGHKITVAFTPARIDQKETLMSLFWAEVREHIREEVHYDDHISLDALSEWNEDEENQSRYEPADPEDMEEYVILRIVIDQIIDSLRAKDPMYGVILDLLREGYSKKEIVQKLPYSQSQSYKKIKDAQNEAWDLYCK